jgi:arsenate reductase
MPTILFLCVANSARSQMAEGLARAMAPPGYRFLSAGSEPGALHPLAVAVMAEVGIDISGQRAKGLDAVPLDEVDTIVTLCAEEVCPVVPGQVRRLHWPLPDPARAAGSEAERRAAFRAARDRLRELLPALWQ